MMRRGDFTGLLRKREIRFEMLNTVNSSELNRKGMTLLRQKGKNRRGRVITTQLVHPRV